MAVFIAVVYTKTWFTATSLISAPINDLELLKKEDSYSAIHPAISDAAIKKLSNQVWYLSKELIGLCFFAESDDVPNTTKRKIVRALKNKMSAKTVKKRKTVSRDNVQSIKIEDYVTNNTRRFFQCLNISQRILEKDPNDLESDDEYIKSKELLIKLSVVNDLAERGVGLMVQYNSILTKDKDQKQFMLQVVEDHRRRFPVPAKSILVAGLSESAKI